MTEEEQAALYQQEMEGFLTNGMDYEAETAAIDDLSATLVPDDYEFPPRECCGVFDDESFDTDIALPCAYGNCHVIYCRCGRSVESGYGRPDCRCQDDNWGHWRVFERKMISVRKVALSITKKRGRTRDA